MNSAICARFAACLTRSRSIACGGTPNAMFWASDVSARKMLCGTWAMVLCQGLTRSPAMGSPSTSNCPSVGASKPISRSRTVRLAAAGAPDKSDARAFADGHIEPVEYPRSIGGIAETNVAESDFFLENQRVLAGGQCIGGDGLVEQLEDFSQRGLAAHDTCPCAVDLLQRRQQALSAHGQSPQYGKSRGDALRTAADAVRQGRRSAPCPWPPSRIADCR